MDAYYRISKVLPSDIRPMREEDVQSVLKLLQAHLNIYKFSVSLSLDDIRHWLLPREGVVYSYVVHHRVFIARMWEEKLPTFFHFTRFRQKP